MKDSNKKPLSHKVVDTAAGSTFGIMHMTGEIICATAIAGEHKFKKLLKDSSLTYEQSAAERQAKTERRLMHAEITVQLANQRAKEKIDAIRKYLPKVEAPEKGILSKKEEATPDVHGITIPVIQ